MNNLEETETEEQDEILERLKEQYPNVYKRVCEDCKDAYVYVDPDNWEFFDLEGKETSEPDDYCLQNDDYYCPVDPEANGGYVCTGCQESIGYHGSTMIIKTPLGEEFNFKFNSTFYIDYESHMEEVNDAGITTEDVVTLMQGRKYHRTDGWRGHHYSEPDKERFSSLNVDFAWLSGHHSNQLVMKQKELLEQAFRELEIPVFYCVHMSSNVFFQNIDAFVLAENSDDADRVISFINDFTGAKDSRWNAGTIMHFDEDKALAEKLEEQLNAQELPDDWSWRDFIDNYDEMVKKVEKFKTEGFAGLSFNQQVGVMAGSGETGLQMAQMMVALKSLKTKKQGDTSESTSSGN